NFLIGALAYLALGRLPSMRKVDRATIAGYYGSDSAGTFATCVAVLAAVNIAFNAYMPVMLAVMEIPGCLVALYFVARLRHRGMDPVGNMPDESGYDPSAPPPIALGEGGHGDHGTTARAVEEEKELALEKMAHPNGNNGGH